MFEPKYNVLHVLIYEFLTCRVQSSSFCEYKIACCLVYFILKITPLAPAPHTGSCSVLMWHLTLSVFELEKIYLHQNRVEFHQKLIGAIVRHQCAHSGTNWPILVDKNDKNLYEVKCQVRTLCNWESTLVYPMYHKKGPKKHYP